MDPELSRRLARLDGPGKLDHRFGFTNLLSIGVLGLVIPIAMIILGWGLGA